MKRILRFITLFVIGCQGFSQNLSLSYANGQLPNGSSFMVSGDANFFMAAYVFVKNNSANPIDVYVKKTELYLVQGTSNYFCWAQCYGGQTYVSPEGIVINGGETDDLHFSGDYDPVGHHGVTSIMYTFFDGNNPNDSAAVTVLFNAGFTGLPENLSAPVLSAAYPNPAQGIANLDFNLPVSAVTASVIVRSVTGQVVASYPLNSSTGQVSMDVSGMESGLYLCSLVLDGREAKTVKLTVQ